MLKDTCNVINSKRNYRNILFLRYPEMVSGTIRWDGIPWYTMVYHFHYPLDTIWWRHQWLNSFLKTKNKFFIVYVIKIKNLLKNLRPMSIVGSTWICFHRMTVTEISKISLPPEQVQSIYSMRSNVWIDPCPKQPPRARRSSVESEHLQCHWEWCWKWQRSFSSSSSSVP